MFIVINNIEQLNDFLKDVGITRSEEIVEVLADKHILIAPNVAQVILEAA